MSANQWLRLWHDMPNDPKWRTIARASGQPLALVQAAYIHLLVDASRNVTRGHATVTHEDLASALDCDTSQIEAIMTAMQGRVLDGDRLTGWSIRQPKREDAGCDETGAKSGAERKRAERERKKNAAEISNATQCHDASRNVTLDTDKDTEKKEEQHLTSFGVGAQARSHTTGNVAEHPTRRAKRAATTTLGVADLEAEGVDRQLAADWLMVRKEKRAPLTQTAWDTVKTEAFKAGMTLNEALHLCIDKSWQGFKASWAENERRTSSSVRPPSRHDLSAVNYGQGGAL